MKDAYFRTFIVISLFNLKYFHKMKKEEIIIVLMGAPGSGKSKLAEYLTINLSAKFNLLPQDIPFIGMGNLLRDEAKQQTRLGLQVKQLLNDGQFAPLSIVRTLFMNAVNNFDHDVPFRILDGCPRNIEQIALFSEVIGERKAIGIWRQAELELVKTRSLSRRICKDCQHVHSIKDGCCPKCAGESILRDDEELIEERFHLFERETLPAIKAFMELYPTIIAPSDWSAPYVARRAADEIYQQKI